MTAPRVTQSARSSTTFEIAPLSAEDDAVRQIFGNPITNLGDGPRGGPGGLSLLASLLKAASEGDEPYLVKYEGSKVPRGLVVDGVPVVWTQHGMVTGEGGARLGTYERLVEFGRPIGIPKSSTDFMLGSEAQWMVVVPPRKAP